MNARSSKKEPYLNFVERWIKHENEVDGDDEPSDPDEESEEVETVDELDDGEISTPKVKEVKMHKSKSPNENIVITSAGHNLVKSIYKYIELLNILNKFSFEIMVSLFKIF